MQARREGSVKIYAAESHAKPYTPLTDIHKTVSSRSCFSPALDLPRLRGMHMEPV